jgi:integrase
VASRIETFTVAEVRAALLAANDRTRLFILLCLNCGMYRNDIAALRPGEVDWKAGVVTRRRSKTRERGGQVVSHKLWPETFALLKAPRAHGDLVLETDGGNPLVKEWIEDGRYRKYDAVRSARSRLAVRMGDEEGPPGDEAPAGTRGGHGPFYPLRPGGAPRAVPNRQPA